MRPPWIWIVLATGLLLAAAFVWWLWIRMPGRSYSGPLPALTERQSALAAALGPDVRALAVEIGERNVSHPVQLAAAAAYVENALRSAGLAAQRQEFKVGDVTCANVFAELRGAARAKEIVVIGAHYDSVLGSPGANDNGSGVAATLAIARAFADRRPARTLRFVAFVNEEPPWFQSESMGSLVYARACRERSDDVVAMLSLETMGCYLDSEGSQRYPVPLLSSIYPSRGNFISFVGNVASGDLVRRALDRFRKAASFPSEGASLPGFTPGVGWSDQWAFWKQGYPAIMVTDTAPFRFAEYHTAHDLPGRVDAERLARVVDGLLAVVDDLADPR